MNETLKTIYERRSVRSYTGESVPDETILEIIKAGVHAPNGMNKQGLRFVVVTNRAKMDQYSATAKSLFVEMLRKRQAQSSSDANNQLIKRLSNPDFDLFYGAPALVLVFASPDCLTPVEDASLAAENMMLAARTYGLGSCWIGFATSLGYSPEFMAEVKVPNDHRLIAPIVLGHPRKEEMKPATREEAKILSWIK